MQVTLRLYSVQKQQKTQLQFKKIEVSQTWKTSVENKEKKNPTIIKDIRVER